MSEEAYIDPDEEAKKKEFENIAASYNKDLPCPNCGYCPHCGRGGIPPEPCGYPNPYIVDRVLNPYIVHHKFMPFEYGYTSTYGNQTITPYLGYAT